MNWEPPKLAKIVFKIIVEETMSDGQVFASSKCFDNKEDAVDFIESYEEEL